MVDKITAPVSQTGLINKVNEIIENGGAITVDTVISSTSENPVQNKVIYNALTVKADKTEIPTIVQTFSSSSTSAPSCKAINSALFLQNKTNRVGALSIEGEPAVVANAINIGGSSTVSGSLGNCVAVGYAATVKDYCTAVGSGAVAYGNYVMALGYGAKATASYAIQIGAGTNSTADTVAIGAYQVLDGSTGKIPNDRLSLDTVPTSASTVPVTSGGVYSALSSKTIEATYSSATETLTLSLS